VQLSRAAGVLPGIKACYQDDSDRTYSSAARGSLTGLSVPFLEVMEPFREVRPNAPAGW
jgi:hypothetical protein